MDHFLRKSDVFGVDLKDRRKAYIWLDQVTGVEGFSVGSSDIEPGAETIPHQHEKETEVMFIYRGRGQALIAERAYPLEPETLMYCPPGVAHQIQNTGDEVLSFVFFYVPGGPEQYLRKL